MGHKIPKFVADKTIINSRHDASLALANSNPHLIARGLIEGASVVHKFGAARDVGVSFVPVTTSQTYPTPMTAVSLEAVSDSADDAPAGSGALTIRIFGITDWTLPEATEDVTLNGTTAVALASDWLRVHRVKVIESGTYASDVASSHSSTITVRVAGAGATWAKVIPDNGFGLSQSEIACYSVPAGKLAYVHTSSILVEANKAANVLFFARENADTVTAPYGAMQAKIILRDIEGGVSLSPDTPIGAFAGPCDIGWMCMATAQTADISIDFEIELFDA